MTPELALQEENTRLRAELHRVQGLWYGACAARTEKAVEIEQLKREILRLTGHPEEPGYSW